MCVGHNVHQSGVLDGAWSMEKEITYISPEIEEGSVSNA